MKSSDSENNDSSIYSEEDYQQITGGKYGKEIFVPHNDIPKHSNGKANKKQQQQKLQVKRNPIIITSEQERERNKILDEIQKLRKENFDLTFEQWSNILLEKHIKFNDKVSEYFLGMDLLADFELSIKTILNIQDITLPFMGIVFAVPSSLKTQFFELLRKLWYSYFTDKFTARSFVSHSANVAKDKLPEIDMLPMIRNKILLTPELSPLFTGKDDNIKEEFGIITRVLDGKGLETNSGVHGKRGYYGNYMFTWLGAAVDIPYSVYKFLSTIGFKIYFLRLPRTKVTAGELVEQLTSKNKFSEKMEEIEKLLMDYLTWFEVCPIAIGQNKAVKIEWDSDKDDIDTIKIIAELALLLAHIRGSVYVYKSSEHEELIPIKNNLNEPTSIINNSSVASTVYSEGFGHSVPIIENPSRANQQLYNLARGRALSYGRNYITKDDILLIIKVVLSTGSIERVLVLELLIANNGTLTTSQIKKSMNISNDTAKRTMTEFEGLELVTMERVGNSSNSEHKISLNPDFSWFLGKEFTELRDKSAASKNTPVRLQEAEQEESSVKNNNNNNDSHRGENTRSKNNTETGANNNIQVVNSSASNAFIPPFLPLPYIEKEKFNNPLISESDLSMGGPYDPEIINNIKRIEGRDRWFCFNCDQKQDKWFMMKHLCNNKKKRSR